MARHNELGTVGEQAARDFLITKGFVIRDQNWRMNHLEIDIVAYEPANNTLHIVEVKTRTSDEHYDPMKAVSAVKQRNLVNAANGYIHFYHLKALIQYDVILVIGHPGNFKIQYIPKAFVPRLKTYR